MEENLKEVTLNQTIQNKKGLWDPKNFIVISFFFSFLPVGILYSLNYGRVGNNKKRNISLVLSLFSFIIFIIALILIPVIIPITMINLILKLLGTSINIGVGVYLRNNQKKLFEEHIENGGNKASFVIPILLSIIVVGMFIFLSIRYDAIPENNVSFYGDEMYYTNSVNVQEAEEVGAFLIETGYFGDDGVDISVKIDKKDSMYILSLCINKEYIDDINLLNFSNQLCEYLPQEVFNGEKVEVHLCDEYFKLMKRISLE